MNVLVIGGGPSDEHEVSMRSARNIFDCLTDTDNNVEFFEWSCDYNWLSANINKFDVILPILHGKGGEDGEIQQFLEKSSAPYLGSDSFISKKCFNKELTKKAVLSLGFKVPQGDLLNLDQYQSSDYISKAHVIKPVGGGSSIHTHIIKKPTDQLSNKVKESFKLFNNLLVEEYIEGQEITVGVLGDKVLPVVEIIPPKGQLFDYENKYNGATKELCPPKNISGDLQQQAQQMALTIHHKLGCRHLSRTDIMVKDDMLYFLEINTIPGLTSQSLFPKAAKAAGIDFYELANNFVSMAGS